MDSIERELIVRNGLNKAHSDLLYNKIAHVIHKNGITGEYNGEPFLVYIKFFRADNEYAAVMTTRYKGKEVEASIPSRALKATSL
jgi:hypothetical protein